MTKKILAAVLSLAVAAACFTACGSDDSSSESKADTNSSAAETADSAADDASAADTDSAAELKAPVNDGAVDVTKGATDNMLTRSVLNEGDTSRLASKIKEALDIANDDSLEVAQKTEKATKVAFLGDSITAGSAASSSQNQYTKQFISWWEENISYFVVGTNAGIGATA